MFSKRSISHGKEAKQPDQKSKEVEIQLNRVLHSILKKSNRIILTLVKSNLHQNQNISLMTAICGIRIIFGRYLALYRWNLLHQSKSISVENFATQEVFQKNVISTFNYIRPLFKSNQQKVKEIHNQNIFSSNPEKIIHKTFKNDIISNYFEKTPFYDFKTKININKKYITIFRPFEYRILIRIKSSNELQLKRFSIIYPKNVIEIINEKIENILKKLSAILNALISKSHNPIESSQRFLHKFYLYGLNSYILHFFYSFQEKYNFKCREVDHYQTLIIFSKLFSPSNEFILTISDSEISLFSKTVLIDGFLSYNFSKSPNLLSAHQIESVISEMQLKLTQTKLNRIWMNIQQSVKNINIPQFKAYLNLTSISIDFTTFDIYSFSLSIDKMTGKTILSFFNKTKKCIFSSLALFIENDYRTDHSIRILFLESLLSILCDIRYFTFQTDLFNPDYSPYVPFSQLFYYNSSSSISTRIVQHDGYPYFLLDSHVETNEVKNFVSNLSLDILTSINFKMTRPDPQMANKIKVVTLLGQFSQELRNRGISTTVDINKVVFIIEPFDSVVFKMNQSLYWSLQFIRPSFMAQRSLSFNGNIINSRFVEWLVDLLVNVSTLLHLYRQTMNEFKINNVIERLDFIDITNFSLSFNSNYECENADFNNSIAKFESNSILYISLDPILNIQTIYDTSMNNSKQMYYFVHSFISPSIQFSFSQFIPLKHQLMSWLKNGQILLLFGSFIKCSLKPLLYFYRLFLYSSPPSTFSSYGKQKNSIHNWSITSLRDDGSFFLIYQRKMSINFMLRPSQVFQLIIPSVGKSQMLKVPLDALPRPCHLSKLSHHAMKLHINQLQKFKTIIENFFGFHDRLIEIGFENFELVDDEVISLFPRHISYASISCVIKPTYVEFRVDNESEIAQNLSKILNFQRGDINIQILIVRLVISLLDFDQKFVALIMRFMVEMAKRTENFGIDWRKTMEKTNIILSEMKVIFNFATARDQFYVELSKNSKDSTTQIMCYDDTRRLSKLKSMKELVNWIQKHENN